MRSSNACAARMWQAMRQRLMAGVVMICLVWGTTDSLIAEVQDVPHIITYQGWLQEEGVNFDGPASFKFALVDAAGSVTYWSHDGSSEGAAEPTGRIPITVTDGLYVVQLGDVNQPGMRNSPSFLPHKIFSYGFGSILAQVQF